MYGLVLARFALFPFCINMNSFLAKQGHEKYSFKSETGKF